MHHVLIHLHFIISLVSQKAKMIWCNFSLFISWFCAFCKNKIYLGWMHMSECKVFVYLGRITLLTRSCIYILLLFQIFYEQSTIDILGWALERLVCICSKKTKNDILSRKNYGLGCELEEINSTLLIWWPSHQDHWHS